jgi:hypothetical protein
LRGSRRPARLWSARPCLWRTASPAISWRTLGQGRSRCQGQACRQPCSTEGATKGRQSEGTTHTKEEKVGIGGRWEMGRCVWSNPLQPAPSRESRGGETQRGGTGAKVSVRDETPNPYNCCQAYPRKSKEALPELQFIMQDPNRTGQLSVAKPTAS